MSSPVPRAQKGRLWCRVLLALMMARACSPMFYRDDPGGIVLVESRGRASRVWPEGQYVDPAQGNP